MVCNPLSHQVVSWWRYIDDVIMVWQGTEVELKSFIGVLNSNLKNIKLTYSNGTIHTDLFRKTTSVNSLLHSSSQHPRHLIRNIPTGQFLRARRICSNDELFENQARDLYTRFKDRGYGKKTICRSYQRAYHCQRNSLLQKRHKDGSTDQVRCILDFNSRSEDVRRAISKYWPVLLTDKTIAQCVGSNPSITYRRSQNLRDHLAHSYHRASDSKFIFGARGPKRSCLPHYTHYYVHNKGRYLSCYLPVWSYLHRDDHTELRRRVREHVLDIEGAVTEADSYKLKPIPRHFKARHGCDPRGLSVKGIDRVFIGPRGGNWKKMLAEKEASNERSQKFELCLFSQVKNKALLVMESFV
ncbi:unnamed protein product [Ranitomeya imitator]|uniref:Helix-turn-helix domain-containing protein n=1 Tax=Ranitomeya imitator TaxID=111125 RepID=A0ABN9M4H6_9NEOB|nr:unnamed protein product [Ranitomeya imitator]